MRCVSLYDKATGYISGHMTVSDDRFLDVNVPPTHGFIDGHYSPDKFKVDLETKELLENTQPIIQPSFDKEMHDARTIRHLDIESIALLRGCALGKLDALKRLQDIDDEIAELRKQLDKG